MKKPSDIYLKKIKDKNWQTEAAQLNALSKLDQCAAHIQTQNSNKWRHRIIRLCHQSQKNFNVFCHGPVGSGKTTLMDCFYKALPQGMAVRYHFYSFMTEIHARLADLNVSNPLSYIAKNFSKHYRVCCLDEFLVNDIADAMVLGGLLQALNQYGVSVITNGNLPPDKLYEHGIQRQSFLKTIKFIKANYHVISCKSSIDFRKSNSLTRCFFQGSITKQDQFLQECFNQLSSSTPHNTTQLTVHQREINIRQKTNHVLWIDFNDLCQPPRAALDYLWLCDHFNYVLLGGVHPINASNKIELVNWIKWVDICYDRGTRLVLAANCALSDICPDFHKDYARCDSRLHEML